MPRTALCGITQKEPYEEIIIKCSVTLASPRACTRLALSDSVSAIAHISSNGIICAYRRAHLLLHGLMIAVKLAVFCRMAYHRAALQKRANNISATIIHTSNSCALPGFVDSKNEEKTERNAGYLVVSQSGGGMLRQGTRKGIRRTPANRGMRAHRVVKGLDISEDVCHGLCP